MKATYQTMTNSGQLVNLKEKDYPIVTSFMSEHAGSVDSYIKKQYNHKTQDEIINTAVKNAMDNVFNRPNARIDVPTDKWLLIKKELKLDVNKEKDGETRSITIVHRKHNLKILLVQKS